MLRIDQMALELSNHELLTRLKSVAHCERKLETRFISYLIEIERRKLYAEEGYSSLFRYLVETLGYAESCALKRIQIARKASRHPRLIEYLDGRISLTAMSKLCPFLNADNIETLLEECVKKSVAQVERVIVRHFPKADIKDRVRRSAIPLSIDRVHVSFSASTEFSEKLERLRALLSHRYPAGKLEDLLGDAVDVLLAKLEPKQIVVARCAKPKRLENRHIPRRIRDEVATRDGRKCTYVSHNGKSCGETAFMQVDHILPWAWGGAHRVDNLRILCGTHNRLMATKYFMRT